MLNCTVRPVGRVTLGGGVTQIISDYRANGYHQHQRWTRNERRPGDDLGFGGQVSSRQRRSETGRVSPLTCCDWSARADDQSTTGSAFVPFGGLPGVDYGRWHRSRYWVNESVKHSSHTRTAWLPLAAILDSTLTRMTPLLRSQIQLHFELVICECLYTIVQLSSSSVRIPYGSRT